MQSQQSTIESRNLQNLMDLLNNESVNFKKSKTYSSQIQDTNARHIIDDVCAHHKQCFDTLNQYLNNPA